MLLCLARSHLKSHMHLGGARLKKDHKSRKIKDLKRLGKRRCGAREHKNIFSVSGSHQTLKDSQGALGW